MKHAKEFISSIPLVLYSFIKIVAVIESILKEYLLRNDIKTLNESRCSFYVIKKKLHAKKEREEKKREKEDITNIMETSKQYISL